MTLLSAVSVMVLVTLEPGSSVAAPYLAAATPLQLLTSRQTRDIQLLDLPGIERLFNGLARQRTSTDEGVRAAAWADFSLLLEAIVDDEGVSALALADLPAAATAARRPSVVAAPGMIVRDRAAYQLLGLGYS